MNKTLIINTKNLIKDINQQTHKHTNQQIKTQIKNKKGVNHE